MTDYLTRKQITDGVNDLVESFPVEDKSMKTFHVAMAGHYSNGAIIEMVATIEPDATESAMSSSNHRNKKHGSVTRTTKAFLKNTRINKE